MKLTAPMLRKIIRETINEAPRRTREVPQNAQPLLDALDGLGQLLDMQNVIPIDDPRCQAFVDAVHEFTTELEHEINGPGKPMYRR